MAGLRTSGPPSLRVTLTAGAPSRSGCVVERAAHTPGIVSGEAPVVAAQGSQAVEGVVQFGLVAFGDHALGLFDRDTAGQGVLQATVADFRIAPRSVLVEHQLLHRAVSAHGGSAIGGLIRSNELDGSQIQHALAVAISAGQLQRGFVWPATAEDGDSEWSYSGKVPMGTYLAIPRSVDIDALGLTPEGRAVALAFQQYGGYVVDRASGVMLYTEPSLEGSAQLSNLRSDMRKLVGQLRIVANNSPHSVNGGGHQ